LMSKFWFPSFDFLFLSPSRRSEEKPEGIGDVRGARTR
jgi:hypothetical protein